MPKLQQTPKKNNINLLMCVVIFVLISCILVVAILLILKYSKKTPVSASGSSTTPNKSSTNISTTEKTCPDPDVYLVDDDSVLAFKEFYEKEFGTLYNELNSFPTSETKELISKFNTNFVTEGLNLLTTRITLDKNVADFSVLHTDRYEIPNNDHFLDEYFSFVEDLVQTYRSPLANTDECFLKKNKLLFFVIDSYDFHSYKSFFVLKEVTLKLLEKKNSKISNKFVINRIVTLLFILMDGLDEILGNFELKKEYFTVWQNEYRNRLRIVILEKYSDFVIRLFGLIVYFLAHEQEVIKDYKPSPIFKYFEDYLYKNGTMYLGIDLLIGHVYQLLGIIEREDGKDKYEILLERMGHLQKLVNDFWDFVNKY